MLRLFFLIQEVRIKEHDVDKNNVEFEPTLLSSEPIAVSKDEAVDALVALGYSSSFLPMDLFLLLYLNKSLP